MVQRNKKVSTIQYLQSMFSPKGFFLASSETERDAQSSKVCNIFSQDYCQYILPISKASIKNYLCFKTYKKFKICVLQYFTKRKIILVA